MTDADDRKKAPTSSKKSDDSKPEKPEKAKNAADQNTTFTILGRSVGNANFLSRPSSSSLVFEPNSFLSAGVDWASGNTAIVRTNFSSLSDDLTARLAGPWVEQSNKLREEIDGLRRTLSEQAKVLRAAEVGTEEEKRKFAELQKNYAELTDKERLGFLLDRVHPAAQEPLRRSKEFQDKFLSNAECLAFVMSVDIRRSTELMLKAKSAQQFADFITDLSRDLTAIVLNSFGVFDKFTGDGILAFFPDFYSGADAAYRVVAAADESHAAFERHYRAARSSFKTVLTDVGLGIGIDYGTVRLVQVAGGLTVVGEPVVYACRLSGAPPAVTLANQPAYEAISTRFGGFCFTKEHQHEIKHEGRMLAYEVRLSNRDHKPVPPEWTQPTTEKSSV